MNGLGQATNLSPYGAGFQPGSTFGSTYGSEFFDPMSQAGGFDFMGNLKGMGPMQMAGTAFGAYDVGSSLFRKNQDLYWGPQAFTTAMEGALTGLSLGGPVGAGIGAVTGYVGGKF